MSFLLLLSAYLLAGCGDDLRSPPSVPPPPVHTAPPPVEPSLQARIDAAVDSIEADSCFVQADPTTCQWADYQIAPAQLDMAKSSGEAILIIDNFGDGFFADLVRYRNRILGVYRINNDQVEPQTIAAHVPKRLGDALISFAGPEFIPAGELEQVAAAVESVYRKLDLIYLGHGGTIFDQLVELVPEQPLILLDMAHLLDIPSEVCQGIDSSSLQAAAGHVTSVVASLRQLIDEHNVRFVNASFGSTVPALVADWPSTCGTAVPSDAQLQQLLQIYAPIYDLLFNSEGIVTAHAAADLGDVNDFPFDQPSARFPNQIRIGYISSLSSGLDDKGRGTVYLVEQFPADGDADVYFNWGCEAPGDCAQPHYELAGNFGITMATIPVMTTSYITPLGLARLINLRYANHGNESMSNALIQQLRQELTPPLCGADNALPCVYQDPIAHAQLEPYRLHYNK